MRTTHLYETWCDEYVIRAELVEGSHRGDEVCVTCEWMGKLDIGGDAVGWIPVKQLLDVPVGEPCIVQVATRTGLTSNVTLPYRVVDRALARLGYEEL